MKVKNTESETASILNESLRNRNLFDSYINITDESKK